MDEKNGLDELMFSILVCGGFALGLFAMAAYEYTRQAIEAGTTGAEVASIALPFFGMGLCLGLLLTALVALLKKRS